MTSRLLSIVVLVLFITSTCSAISTSLLGGRYVLSWTVNSTASTVTFTVDTTVKGWAGLGWHLLGNSEHDMRFADIVVAQFNDDGTLKSVSDMKALSNDKPFLDTDPTIGGTYDILSYSGRQYPTANGQFHSTFTFTRSLATNDTEGDHWLTNGLQTFIYAVGQSNEFAVHHISDCGYVRLNLITGAIAKSHHGLPTVHGVLMSFAFIVCMSTAACIARYTKQYPWWFPVHYCLGGLGILCMIAGVIVALFMVGGFSLNHVHEWFGWITLIIAFCTPFIGIASHFTFNPERIRAPVVPDMLHWWFGRVTLVMAYITILLGLIYVHAPFWIYIIFAVAAAIFIVVWVAQEYLAIQQKGWGAYWSVSYEYIGEPEELNTLLTTK